MSDPSSRKKILIIDDDRLFCDAAADFLAGQDMQVLIANRGADGVDLCRLHSFDVVLLDQKLPDVQGHTLCGAILERNDQTKIIFITAHPSFDTAIQAIRAGAYDYLSKPFELEELALTITRALRMISLEKVARLDEYKNRREGTETVLIGDAEGLAEITKLVALAASVDAPVLITGETGTGKNVVARSIHYRGANRASAFITINCASLPENLIEAELFGHERGAFTGAVAAKAGIFEMAEGGTLLLDEIGEMPIHLQTKLLGVLEDKQIRRIGGETFRPVHVRILAATSKDLEQALGKSFRKDLYYRLSVIRIHVPPLRERSRDIPKLCEHLLASISSVRHDALPESELKKLMSYDWPGNVRELKNVLERATILQRGRETRPSELLEVRPGVEPRPLPPESAAGDLLPLETVEREHIHRILTLHQFNRSKVARLLGISLSTLKRKIRTYDLK